MNAAVIKDMNQIRSILIGADRLDVILRVFVVKEVAARPADAFASPDLLGSIAQRMRMNVRQEDTNACSDV